MLVFLVGYMGSGKSSLGKSLSRQLNYSFIDLDTHIENACGEKITDIFHNRGEEWFREIESRELRRLCEEGRDAVVAVGGGTPCFYDNMEQMNSSGLTIFIDVDRGILCSRLKKSKRSRPLISSKNDDELLEYIGQMLDERVPFYKQSKIRISSKNLNVKDILFAIENYQSALTY